MVHYTTAQLDYFFCLLVMCQGLFWFGPQSLRSGSPLALWLEVSQSWMFVPLPFTWAHTHRQPRLPTRDYGKRQKKQSPPYWPCTRQFLSFKEEVTHHRNLPGGFFCTCACWCVYVRRWCLVSCLAPDWLSRRRQSNKEVEQGESLFNYVCRCCIPLVSTPKVVR